MSKTQKPPDDLFPLALYRARATYNDDGEGAYTIFSTQQLFGPDCVPLDVMGIQKFAVLWEGQPDTRVIDLIEQSIILNLLSPVKLLNASKGMLVVVYNDVLVGESFELFHLGWEEIAAGVMYDDWTVLLTRTWDSWRESATGSKPIP